MIPWMLATALAAIPGSPDYVPPAVDADPRHVPLDARWSAGVEDAAVTPGGRAVAQLRYAYDPLLWNGPGLDPVAIVRSSSTLTLAGAWSTRRLRVGLVVPTVVRQTSDLYDGWRTAVADPAVDAKLAIVQPDHGTGLAARARVTAPLGAATSQAGATGPGADVELIGEQALGPLVVLLNVGGHLTPGTDLGLERSGSAFTGRAALAWAPAPGWTTFAELHAQTRFQGLNTTPAEVAIGLSAPVSTGRLWASGGTAVLPGVGAALVRADVGLSVPLRPP